MSTQPPFTPAGPNPPYAQYPPPLAPKKPISPIVWILIGLGSLFLIVVLAVVGAGFFLVHKVKQAGVDPDLMRRNPALGAARMMAALNPDIEVLSVDENGGTLSVREKKTGKTYSVNFDDAKKGKFVLREDGKAPVTITANGDGSTGSLDIKSEDGSTVKIGAGGSAKVPAWLPEYPASDPRGVFSAQSGDGSSGSFGFKTKDPVSKVTRFYEDGFKEMGMKTTSTISNADGKQSGGMLSAEGGKKTAVVLLGSEGGDTTVSVTFSTKK